MEYSKCDDGDACLCGRCHPTCKTCIGGLATQCSSCPYGFYLTPEGTCVESCSKGEYVSNDGLHCFW